MSKDDRTPRARGIRRRAALKAQRRTRRLTLRSATLAATAAAATVVAPSAAPGDTFPTPAPSHGVQLLKDITRGRIGSYPRYLTDVRGTLFFTASDGRHGWELWRSDGTSPGTVMVKDIWRGKQQSWPQQLTAVGDELFFTAYDGIHGREVWKSDGTRSGTVMVRNIHPSVVDNHYPEDLTNVDGTLFFTAEDGVHGRALWKSNGSRHGTKLVKDLDPRGPYEEEDRNFGYFSAVGRSLLFSADDGTHGFELWRSDGTRDGTVLVEDIAPGEESSAPRRMTAIGDTLFFSATNDFGRELWTSDGTVSGTARITDIGPPDYGDEYGPYPLGRLGDRLVFYQKGHEAGWGVWISDGTTAGTRNLAHVGEASGPGGLLRRGRDRELYFYTRYDGLWKTNGTAAGTVEVTDLPNNDDFCYPSWLCWDVGYMVSTGDDLYFSLHDLALGTELWTSDGTARGTGPVEDFVRGHYGTYAQYLTESDGTVFFVGQDPRHGPEVYRVGGPPPGVPKCDGLKPTIVGFGQITGTPGDDVIVGSAGPDQIDGRGGRDVICGGGDGDTIDGGAGADVIRGGPGPDTADYGTRTTSVRVTLDPRSGADDGSPGERDDIRGVESVVGGSRDDVLIGSPGANTLTGGGGDDTIDGRDGDDLEYGGDGDDVFVTGAAADGADLLEGQAGADIADYSARTAALQLDMTTSDVGDDGAPGEGDNLRPTTEGVRGGAGGDTIAGTMLDNLIWGGPGDDDIVGRRGDDMVDGGVGDDSLDTLDHVGGNDTASGGPGTDTAVFDAGDVITEVP